MQKDTVHHIMSNYRDEAIELQRNLTSYVAYAPEYGGIGEIERAHYLLGYLKEKQFDQVELIEVPDERVPSNVRPNIIITVPGIDITQNIWIISHLDTVPPGDLQLWEMPPHQLTIVDNKLYGRGTEDNQQGVVSSILTALALKEQRITPQKTVKIVLASDEESGSTYGFSYLLTHYRHLFGPNDVFLVPDSGDSEGSTIQVAEKNIYVLKCTVIGKQAHAAHPEKGINAFVSSSRFVIELSELTTLFSSIHDDTFSPPYSTFTPTQHTANVQSSNILPGTDEFYVDCRVLPELEFFEVTKQIERIAQEIEMRDSVTISWEIMGKKESKATSDDAPIVKKLSSILYEQRGIKARTIGIGGGTIAGDIRNAGMDAVVWATLEGKAHMPNEYCVVEHLLSDAEVFYQLCVSDWT